PPYSSGDLREKVRCFSAKQNVEIELLPDQPLQVGTRTVRCSPFADAVANETHANVRSSPFADAGNNQTHTPPVSLPDAYYGVLGDFVIAVEPHTEADTIGVLACLLCSVGNVLGRNIHHQI